MEATLGSFCCINALRLIKRNFESCWKAGHRTWRKRQKSKQQLQKKKLTDKRTNNLPPLKKTTGNKVSLQHFSRQRVTGQVRGFSSMRSKKSSGRQAGNATHLYWNILSRSDMRAKGRTAEKKNSSNEMGWTKKQTINAFSTLDTGKNQVWEGGTGQQNIKHTPMIWNRQWQLSFLHFIL